MKHEVIQETPMNDDEDHSQIGERLKRIRRGMSDLNQGQWSAKHNFTQGQYSNWERGTRRISVDAAMALCALYGVTLDYIYLGREDALSEKTRNSLSGQ